jgi:hypothetical protein
MPESPCKLEVRLSGLSAEYAGDLRGRQESRKQRPEALFQTNMTFSHAQVFMVTGYCPHQEMQRKIR